jgi:hypothetical protein
MTCRPPFVPSSLLLVVALLATGCGDTDPANAAGAGSNTGNESPAANTGNSGDERALLPALGGFAVVLEAESGAVKPSMVKEDVKPTGASSIHKASGGKCVAVPKGANAACKARKEDPVGSVTLTFEVPEDGTYYIYPRVRWQDGCSNSFAMTVDGGKPIDITSGNYDKDGPNDPWHWIKLKPIEPGEKGYRPFKLKKGKHTLVFHNREDDTRLDQVYITDDPEQKVAGIMQGFE